MTKEQLVKKFPELFLECIKEGIELALYGYTEINNINNVEKYNEEIKQKLIRWENENELLELI